MTARYCPSCGGPLVRRRPPGDERERQVCTACGRIHYENPKIVVGSVSRLGERILLCRRAIEPAAGKWTIPAGFLELGESAEQGAQREAFEEARARITLLGLLAVYSIPQIGQVQLMYLADLLSPELEAGPESLEVALFAPHEIPWGELAFPTVHRVLTRSLELARKPAPLVPVLETLAAADAEDGAV